MRASAVDALCILGEQEASAVDALTECLKHPDSSVRRLAAEALGNLGEYAAGLKDSIGERPNHSNI